jgi:integrase
LSKLSRRGVRNKLIRTLRAVLSWAVPEYLKDNPARAIHFAEEVEKDKRTLSPEEFFKTLEVVDDRGQAVLMFGTCCGFRREEIAYLQWEDLALDTAVARIRNTE